jgi:hypothetical protein
MLDARYNFDLFSLHCLKQHDCCISIITSHQLRKPRRSENIPTAPIQADSKLRGDLSNHEIKHPSGPSRVGNVEVHDVFPVTELDAGYFIEFHRSGSTSGQLGTPFSHGSFRAIETQLAITVPCLDEETDLLEGVLKGVPHDCLIILVSKSNPFNFEAERDMVTKFNRNTQLSAIFIH